MASPLSKHWCHHNSTLCCHIPYHRVGNLWPSTSLLDCKSHHPLSLTMLAGADVSWMKFNDMWKATGSPSLLYHITVHVTASWGCQNVRTGKEKHSCMLCIFNCKSRVAKHELDWLLDPLTLSSQSCSVHWHFLSGFSQLAPVLFIPTVFFVFLRVFMPLPWLTRFPPSSCFLSKTSQILI